MRALMPIAGLLFTGCAAAVPANQSLPVEQACLVSDDTRQPITIEIATSPAQRSQGLMSRPSLDADSGMLFVYRNERDPEDSFWMYRTLIPLDIAYLDQDGTIRAIHQMDPCPAEKGRNCPRYPAGVPYYYALEMNQGYFQNRGLSAGDRLLRGSSACQ
ncbi:DUF192 domain-containing protein [Marinobacter confluentis]|uniref:DUF192 domain-containing protein n=1 Tax=Marinobacter confluentis TaxID=1697557 RepID=A0A4Z1BXR1_9GAMM|nr:DUF192 domain-containing protein [Marinobacter confluentis]